MFNVEYPMPNNPTLLANNFVRRMSGRCHAKNAKKTVRR
jgi:hypothetical protein